MDTNKLLVPNWEYFRANVFKCTGCEKKCLVCRDKKPIKCLLQGGKDE